MSLAASTVGLHNLNAAQQEYAGLGDAPLQIQAEGEV